MQVCIVKDLKIQLEAESKHTQEVKEHEAVNRTEIIHVLSQVSQLLTESSF